MASGITLIVLYNKLSTGIYLLDATENDAMLTCMEHWLEYTWCSVISIFVKKDLGVGTWEIYKD